jgi:hypothetical protein
MGVDDASVKVLKSWISRSFYNMQRAVFKPAGGVKRVAGGPPAYLHEYESGTLLSADQLATLLSGHSHIEWKLNWGADIYIYSTQEPWTFKSRVESHKK